MPENPLLPQALLSKMESTQAAIVLRNAGSWRRMERKGQLIPLRLIEGIRMRVRVRGLWRLIQLIVLCVGLPMHISAQERTAPSLEPLDEAGMQSELLRLEEICGNLGLAAEADLCRSWIPTARPDQALFFLPVETRQSSASNPKQAAWVKHFETARARHAEYWFQQCRHAIEMGDESRGYQLLWRTLRENPQHAEAKRTLGRLATSCSVRPVVRRSTAKHPTYGWSGNTYNRVESPHFLLTSRATTAETIELAMKLEEFYAIWTQFFFPLWSPPGLLKSRLGGGSSSFEAQRQIKVVLLRDRADYVEALAAEKNIGVSVGYYDPDRQTSYFFPDKNLAATFYHELTHQLLAEATRLQTADNIGSRGDVWLLEGIALYMESLWRGDGFWTLGGWDAPRLQVARYRAVRDGYFAPWDEFSGGQLEQWKADPDISRLYSQAAGIVHVMLDRTNATEKERRKQAVFQSLVAMYQGSPDSKSILIELGGPAAQENYEQELTITNEQIGGLSSTRQLRDLVLAGSQLNAEAWQRIMEQTALEWLDVSFSNATSADLKAIGKLKGLERLSVEGTAVDNQLLDSLRQLPKLTELDLTGCAIDDVGLKKLAKLPQLNTLWLGKTQVTDQSLDILADMPRLKFVDVQESKISSDKWAEFVKLNPRFGSER
jgi:Leucine Rich repeat